MNIPIRHVMICNKKLHLASETNTRTMFSMLWDCDTHEIFSFILCVYFMSRSKKKVGYLYFHIFL